MKIVKKVEKRRKGGTNLKQKRKTLVAVERERERERERAVSSENKGKHIKETGNRSKNICSLGQIFALIILIIIGIGVQTVFAKYVIKVSNEIELKLKLVQMSGEDIKITPEEWTNGNVTVTINTDKSGEVYYKVNESGEWKKYEKNFEVEENCKIYAKIKYEDGESNEVEKEVTNIDKKIQ